MKPVDKKDMPKLVALCAIAVLLFGVAAYQFVAYGGGGTPAAAALPPAANKVADVSGVTAPGGTTGTVAAADAPAFDLATLGPPSGGKDPFTPLDGGKVVLPPPPPVPVAAAPPPVHPTGGLPIPIAAAMGKPTGPLTWDASPQLEGTSNAPAAAAPLPVPPVVVPSPPPPPPPAYTVTGIVMGDRSAGDTRAVAILRGGGNVVVPSSDKDATAAATSGGAVDRRFVTVGDPVGNGFVVAAVRADGVDLKSGSRRVTLKLGGVSSAARVN
jgi:hypothetical protein